MRGYRSTKIDNVERAGRAPYNFVPLPNEKRESIHKEPPSHDRFGGGLLSGRIDLDIEALEDFYIRGMWEYEKYSGAKEDRPVQVEHFQIDEKLRLPGSSLRGMFRTLVEILSAAPLDRLNDSQLFFRTVAAVPDPRNARSFEPQAASYKKRIVPGGKLAVRVGYLFNTRDRWTIRDAIVDAQGRQLFRYRTTQQWLRREARFDIEPQPVRFDVDRHAHANVNDQGRERGWMICSGWIYGKTKQWVVREVNQQATLLEIPLEDVEAYKNGGITLDIKNKGFAYDDQTQGVPCVYVKWNDASGKEHISFGHTPYFRLPYVARPPERIPKPASREARETEWDMASAMFGHVPRDKDAAKSRRAWRGRLVFEDAVQVGEASVAEEPVELVLGQPKPTTFQHYIVQRTEALQGSLHWDGDYQGNGTVVLRGHKMYWHRPGESAKGRPPGGKEKVTSRFKPGKAGAKFRASIHYENLDPRELGALLTAIELPEGCAHRLGMAKPFGYGSFQIRIAHHVEIDRQARYRAFFNADGALTDGAKVPDGQVCKEAYARWYLQSERATWEQLWVPGQRLHDLKCLLTWNVPHNRDKWANMTRYLEFGAMPESYNGGRNYNEYQEWGTHKLPRPQLQKRRPLPPAPQVLSGGPAIPDDPRPNFVEPRRRGPGEGGPRRGANWRNR